MRETGKNNSIVIWRILFTYLIMAYHFDNKYAISQHFGLAIGWYIGVEFFFIVSGYLLYAKFDSLSQSYRSAPAYVWMRFQKIYPFYLGAFLLSLFFYVVTDAQMRGVDVIKLLSDDYFEVLALQGIGLDDGWNYVNNTGWFISILLISSFIIYHCLLKWRDTFVNFAVPLIVMISFSFLYRNMKGIGGVVQTTGFYENWALMRGMADMCLGICAARLSSRIGKQFRRKGWIRAVGACGFLFVIGCSLKYGNSTADFLYTLILTLSVAIGFLPSESRIYDNKWLQKWSGLTLYMYLVHDMFRTFIFPHFLGIPAGLPQKAGYLVLFLFVVTAFAILFRWVVSGLMGPLRKLWRRM